ncbi:uncharacterized protein TRUGW13939_00951 [Talaromyces rugulosus]|uniref:Uncharacterized protein n=1 Tax=Talaromyces rugulosus TaxID=121627 RepID=A0A7H8QJY4_TALRU|nr:uncharacterized protein TRUGW13939_00951 [Talaromyces rugulosus]QKX53871.1 hypothetical protein TRUGW13939_00951 [Talaromyces rugulosus]
MADTHGSEDTTHELEVSPGLVTVRGRVDITTLPLEIIQMIGKIMLTEDLVRVIQSCKALYGQLTYVLYRRMVAANNHHNAIVHCILRNRATPLSRFLDAGAILDNGAAREYHATAIATCDKNAGFLSKHPLVSAASLGHAEIVRLLLRRAEAVTWQSRTVIKFSALLEAIKHGHVEVVRILVDAGVDLRGSSTSRLQPTIPLVLAATHKSIDMVKIITAKMRAETETYRAQTYFSQCGHALRAAIQADSHEIVEFFLRDGLHPNASRTTESFLYTAATTTPSSYNRTVIVKLLMAYGASTVKSDPGLIKASWNKNFEVVNHVLTEGCDWKYKMREVRWARLMAENEGQQDVVQLWNEYVDQRIRDGGDMA